MSLIKKPSELEVTPALTALIYGQPGTGKTTLACSAPSPVLFDFDGGVGRIHAAHQVPTVQVHSWEEVLEALEEVKRSPEYKSIIIDTAGKMLAFMEDYIKRKNPKMKKADGSLSLQGYGQRKQMFIQFNKDVCISGRNVIYVAHEIEQKRGDETIIRPEVGGSSSNDLIKELDLVGYIEMSGKQRTITFDPCEKFYAKNTCNMNGVIAIPHTVDDNGEAIGQNNFMQTVVSNYHKRLKKNQELASQYEMLCDTIRENIATVETAEDANKIFQWLEGLTHIFNSKIVAWQALQVRAKELNINYDKLTKSFIDGNAA